MRTRAGPSEPEGRGAAWTEERGTSDEGRRRLVPPRRRAENTATARQARGSRLRAGQQPARLPPGIASVLSVLSSSAVVLDSNDKVLRASGPALSLIHI